MICPKCGKEMKQGRMPSGGGKCWLLWYPGEKRPSTTKLLSHGFPLFRRGNPEDGMVLYPWTDDFMYLPAWNCPECMVLILDYKEENAQK